MQDVAPGRTIGGRYTLNERRLASADGVEAWSATDAATHVEVTLTLFSATASTSPAILDAARRAAHVQDPRLVRILDVGTSGHLSWIVEEHHSGAGTLVDVVEENPLTGDQARTVVGEAAAALAVASRRGMHHLRLTPYSVLVTPAGDIKVSGLGTVRALEGVAEPPIDRAEQLDALGLLAIGYYALTTRWPLPTEVPGILPAPHIVGGVPAPSELTAGVPADLDQLCRVGLNGEGGPASPEQLIAELTPWRASLRETSLDHLALRPDPTSHRPDAADLPILPVTDAPPVEPVADTAPVEPVTDTAPVELADDTAPDAEAEELPEQQPVQAPAALTPEPDHQPSAPAAEPDQQPEPQPSTHEPEIVSAPGVPASPGVPTAADEADAPDGPAADDTGEPRDARSAAKTAALAVAASAAAGATAAGEVAGRLGTMARNAAEKAQLKTEEVRARVAAERAERERADAQAVRLADIPDETDAEAPGPLMRMLDPHERPGTHANVVLASVAGFVALALLIAMFVVVRGLGRTTESVASAAATSSGTPASSAARSATAAPTGPTPLNILRGESIDPVGRDGENDAQIPRAYDGNPDTRWQSEMYRSGPRWDGTEARSVGLAFRLERSVALRSVKLTFPASPGQSGAIYVGPDARIAGATKVGEFTDATGAQEIQLSGAPEAPYVIVLFTKAPRDGGGFRATLAEIAPMG
ncbi:MAG: hypothetical protein IPK37_07045 [Austwickia sp.]|nr:MAG: hypothetical protein IPK37_07045 [Austwickia sp.]